MINLTLATYSCDISEMNGEPRKNITCRITGGYTLMWIEGSQRCNLSGISGKHNGPELQPMYSKRSKSGLTSRNHCRTHYRTIENLEESVKIIDEILPKGFHESCPVWRNTKIGGEIKLMRENTRNLYKQRRENRRKDCANYRRSFNVYKDKIKKENLDTVIDFFSSLENTSESSR